MRSRAGTLRALRRAVSRWRLCGALLLAVLPIIAGGCGERETAGGAGQEGGQGAGVSAADSRPVVVSGQPFALASGQAFHFVDHFEGDTTYAADLSVGGDGHRRILLGDARQPVLCAPAPYTIRQKVRLPRGAKLRTAFGLTRSSWNKVGAGARFVVRLKTGDRTTELLSAEVKRWGGADAAHWTPVTVDLPDTGGREVEIELATEMAGEPREGPSENFSHVYAVWLNPALTAPPPKPRPNIVVVLLDALRPDHLGSYGYARETSPFLDEVADSGILFESGIPCLTFGPIGAGEHTATEWVDVESVETCAKV
ncbi:MAG: sulfatase-like hydrolase/transferase, partial [Armatimonadetes bacterium]|nr:sulfatase-like hydrolase/transferase [Armatimonadota bacterium]